MTELLDRAISAAKGLAPEAQDEIAHVVLRLLGDEEPPAVSLTAEERNAIAHSRACATNAENGFATDEQIRAAWSKHGQ